MRIYNEILGEYVEIVRWPIEKIVSMSSGLTESLYMMGLGDIVVGTDAFSNKPSEARKKPKVGSYTHVNMDMIRELKPDIVVTITGVQRGIIERLRSEKIPVYPLPMPTDVAGIISNASILGYITGYIDRARELTMGLYGKLSELVTRRSNSVRKILVVLDFGPRGGLWSPGGASHISDAIHIVGGISITDKEPLSYIETSSIITKVRDIDLVVYENSSYITSENPIGYRSLVEMLEKAGIRYHKLETFQEETLAHTGPSFILESMSKLKNLIEYL
ncbi:MAG: ABC transporter substrate-binding protein [Desulfurococcales archaeon]|nr:ABC transporter substrate-binding protein [Desulfurococcales archaeon]